MYSYELEDASQKAGEGRPRFNILHRDRNLPMELSVPGVSNVYDIFLLGKRRSNDGPYLGKRDINPEDGSAGPYRWLSYSEVGSMASDFGSGLARLGVEFGELVGYYCKNSIECYMGRLAGHEYGYVMVPMYETIGPNAVTNALVECEMKTVVTLAANLEKLLDIVRNEKSCQESLRLIVLLDSQVDDVAAEHLQAAEKLGIKLHGFKEACSLGANPSRQPPARTPTKEDLALIMYTSGTSSNSPKAAKLTHGNLMYMQAVAETGLQNESSSLFELGGRNVFLSFLPMAHLYEQGTSLMVTGNGGQIGMSRGNPQLLLEDAQFLKPTMFAGVPRLFNRIHDKVWSTIRAKGGVAQYLFEWAVATKLANMKATGQLTHWLWDRLVFGKIRSMLGGEVRCFMSSSAPITAEVKNFMRIAFSIPVVEALGMTEATAVCSITSDKDLDAGHVGGPQLGVLVKLVDVPDMGYTSADKPYPRGEICVKGQGVFAGYLKNPEKTAEVIDADGYYHTGDIGMWDEQGRLVLFDRKSSFVKLSQGEFLALDRIASVIENHPLVQQAFVHAEPIQSFVIGVVVPDEEMVRPFLAEHPELGIDSSAPFADICASDALKKHLLKTLDEWCRASKCMGFEILKNVHVESAPFSVENKLLTPTLKLKRNAVRDHYREKLTAMYAEGAISY
ncbi:acetyl-CoA synthetase-like protein [Ramicandelaber brevisporus]|nr:acetyl-CoA synthetase-like protein [Ramicandelaber brevisporus]